MNEELSTGRSAKRQRVDNDENDAGDDDLLAMMMATTNKHDANGDEESERKREARRQARLQRMEQYTATAVDVLPIPVESSGNENTNNNGNYDSESQQQSAAVIMNQLESIKADYDYKYDEKKEDESNNFDIFSSSVSPITTTTTKITTKAGMAADYQDEEGYYKAVMGETLFLANFQFTVLGQVGKGVFSTVLQCSTTSNTTVTSLPSTVALKIIRANDTMAKAAQAEAKILQTLSSSNHPHIVSLLIPDLIEHRGHVVLVFPYTHYNLRDVLQKFGKGIGLSLTAVASYFGQLLKALHHLQKHNIIHADIKPDNILVNQDFSTCQLCDFGSAMEVGSTLPTPYLVSRYYRAPEVMLGGTPTPSLDLWSVAVTMAELFTGSVIFSGQSNNDMMFQFMTKLGPVPNKTIRQHLVAMTKHAGITPIFSPSYQFLQSSTDPVTGHAVVQPMMLQRFPTKPLQQILLQSKSHTDARPLVLLFSNILQKCLALEPTRRLSVVEAMKHEFFTGGGVVGKNEQTAATKIT